METFELVTIERTGAVATVTIQRPDKLNALNARVVAELTQAFTGLSASAEPVRCAILTGAGKAFVAGADIAEMATLSTMEAKRFADAGHALGALLEALPFPVIAAVNGFALGGGASWRWPATSSTPPRRQARPARGQPRHHPPASAGRSGSSAAWARPGPASSSTPAT